MGWTVLYIAFGIVALWLLGEVLLQYKARLRWRLLAFGGFLGVVFGVLIPSVVVIGLGAIAFAVGQTYVTLSFRQGFAAGWAVGNRQRENEGGGSKRRRGEEAPPEEAAQAAPDVSAFEATVTAAYHLDGTYDDHDDVFTRPSAPGGEAPGKSVDGMEHAGATAEATAVYEPQPLPEETGSYGVYTDKAFAASAADAAEGSYPGAGQPADQQTDASYAGAGQPQPQDQGAYAYDGYSGYDQQQYGYDNGQQQYAGYSDPYAGTQNYGGGSYDPSYGDQQQYGQQQYGQDQYAGGGYGETPAGGAWVPQQRTDENTYGGELPPEQPYPYQDTGASQGNGAAQSNGGAHGHGYDEQYRF
ncbi:SCO2102 family sporulation regulator [Streptomyces nodosus]|uniref:Membrane protein n=1 Tax=Streptomyces nodosus TaxID=40318 RepID=A0A0B5DGL5_9ACTN|nr:hypothetical protein [Streptomyces nodosus]AJE40300.1 membrane protein [Streptomyces nodosus]MBB4791325.1 hypothetical protein [Streptomyces nodosus]QEV38874.1 hypothetical protein CP978_10155 [Streptomyces nodosus]